MTMCRYRWLERERLGHERGLEPCGECPACVDAAENVEPIDGSVPTDVPGEYEHPGAGEEMTPVEGDTLGAHQGESRRPTRSSS